MSDLLDTTLVTASYAGVEFPTPDVSADGGHTLIRHRAYRKRGVDLEPTGQKEYEGQLTAIMVNNLYGWGAGGANFFPGRFTDLIDALTNNPIGELWHPFLGHMTVGIEKWSIRFAVDVRNGAYVDIHWVEHNATATTLNGPDNAPNTDSTQQVAAQAQAADTSMALVTNRYTPTLPVMLTQLTTLASTTLTAAQMSGSIGTMLAVVNTNLALPYFSAATAHDAVVQLETLRGLIYGLSQLLLGAYSSTQTYVVQAPMAVWAVARVVYGNASKGNLILSANPNIGNPSNIPVGTVLAIPALV